VPFAAPLTGPAPFAPPASPGRPGFGGGRPGEKPYERADVRRATGGAIRPGGLALTDRAMDLLPFAAGARLLDCGCGAGATLSRLAAAGFRAAGCDISAVLAAEAAGRVPGRALRAEAGALPFAPAIFDGVFGECVLSALDRPEAALEEIARVIVPGGYLVVSDLYLRSGLPGSGGAGTGCAAGALPREVAELRFARHGLPAVVFEDHTRHLIDLSCRLVLELGSAREVMAVLTGREPGCAGDGQKPRLGYGLWICRKEA
jgi:SAM-dependent methyltransferase